MAFVRVIDRQSGSSQSRTDPGCPTFASRRLIDEPQELADRPNPRSRYSTATLPDCIENRRFFLASHQKRNTPATLQHGVGHGDANLGAPVGDNRHPALALVERGLSRKQ
jgi:hypothetical protein